MHDADDVFATGMRHKTYFDWNLPAVARQRDYFSAWPHRPHQRIVVK